MKRFQKFLLFILWALSQCLDAQQILPCETSFSYPSTGINYPALDNQVFELQLEEGNRFEITFELLELASGDTLWFFDPSFPNLPPLLTLSESSLASGFSSLSNKLRLEFRSDSEFESTGFQFNIKCIPSYIFQAVASTDSICAGTSSFLTLENTFPYSGPFSVRYLSNSEQGTLISSTGNDTVSFSIPAQWNELSYTLFIEPSDSLWFGLADTLLLTVEPLQPSPEIIGDTTFCGAEVSLSASPPWPVIWFLNGDTLSNLASASINTSIAGVYRAQNLTGCGSLPSESHTLILLSSPEAPLWLSENEIQLCNGDSAQVDFSAGSGSATLFGPADTLSINPGPLELFAPGQYWLSTTNQCGTAYSDTLTISPLLPPPAFGINYTGSLQLCENQQLLLSVSNADPSIFWQRDGLDISVGNPTLAVNSAGNYTASMSNVCGITWASDTLSISIVELPEAPALSAAGPTTLCEGNTAVLLAEVAQGETIQWYNNGEALSNNNNALQVNTTGLYSVSATNGCGEVFSLQSIPVLINPLPEAPLLFTQGNPYLCNGSDVFIGTAAQSGVSWQWKRNGSNIASQTNSITVSQPGLYTVVASNGCGDSASLNSISVFSGNPPTLPVPTALGSTSFCEGNSVALSTNPQNGVLIEWLLNGQSSGLTGFQVNATEPGNYTVRVSNACDTLLSAQSIPVTVFPLPPVVTFSNFDLLSLCEGDSFTFAIDPLPGVSYQWRRNGQISGPNAPQYTIQQEGVYSLQLVNSCGSTPAAYPVTVNVDSAAATMSEIVAQPGTALCPGGYVILNAQSVPFQTYNWYLNNELLTSGLASSIIATEWGTYTLQNSNACGASALSGGLSLGPGDPPPPFELFSNTGELEFCENDSLLITAQVPFGVAIRWFLEGDSLSETSAQLWAKLPGTYTAIGWNGCGEANALNSISLSTLPAPPTPAVSEMGGVLFTEGEGSIQWLDSAGQAIDGAVQISYLPPPADGIYSVSITAANGCRSVSAPFVYQVNYTSGLSVERLELWPNPVVDRLLLSGGTQGAAFQVLDLRGRVLAAGVFPADGSTLVPVDQLSAGVYWIRSGLFVAPFVKTNP